MNTSKVNPMVVLNKVQTIERCVARSREDYAAAGQNFATNFPLQDSAVMNVLRACEAASDLAQHIISKEALGVSQGVKDAFAMLHRHKIIDAKLSASLQAMVGFRNVAVHDYQTLELDKVVYAITHGLNDLLVFGSLLLTRYKPF